MSRRGVQYKKRACAQLVRKEHGWLELATVDHTDSLLKTPVSGAVLSLRNGVVIAEHLNERHEKAVNVKENLYTAYPGNLLQLRQSFHNP